MKNLVIVESPTKARTIGRYLGKDYEIKFSMGHLIDLPKSKTGIAIEHDFKPEYEVLEDKKKIIADLRKAAKGVGTIILATDPDREGEAIAANIKELLEGKSKKGDNKFKRIVFHEITKDAIREAFKHPRDIDENLVNAQTARRVLDRLVGYQLSPILWRKVRRGLSAGRVQSVALRLIVEREREIEKFAKKQYWTIHVDLHKNKDVVPFDLIEINNDKIEVQDAFALYDGEYKSTRTVIDTQQKADSFVEDIKKHIFIIAEVNEKEVKRSPYPPFATSTLQQEASRRFGFPGKRTMSLAQKLYEEGYITYHRTDSVTLSASAVTQMRTFIGKTFGDTYLPEKPRFYTTKQKAAQEAHEAIRPTHIDSPESGQMQAIQKELGREYARLYDIIWRRAVASQMTDAIIESTTIVADSQDQKSNINNQKGAAYRLRTTGSVLKFDGFLRLNPQALQDTRLPHFAVGDTCAAESVRSEEHETPPPPRYNDASIIATLEDKGIGRPSTYAAIIGTLTDRAYVERVEKRFEPTPVGLAVNDFLVKNFSDIDDIPFTAEMEDQLDRVAQGEKEWVSMMKDFYTPFAKSLDKVEDADRVKIEVEQTDEVCPECKLDNLVVRTGKFGKFLSCARFPDCKFTKPFVEETNVLCPKDGGLSAGRQGKIIIKKTRKGRKFFGCSNYPKCDFAAWKLEDIKGSSNVKTSSYAKATKDKQNAKPQLKV